MRTIPCTCLLALIIGCSNSTPATADNSGAKDATPAPPAKTAYAKQTKSKTSTNATTNGKGNNMNAMAELPAPPMTFTQGNTGLPEEGMWKCDPVLVDVNGDGNMDLAAIRRLGDGPRVWLGNGKGEWTPSSRGLDPEKASCGGGLDFADINKDGHIDMVAADHCQGVYVYLGDGKGNWTEVCSELNPVIEVNRDEPRELAMVGAEDVSIADLTGDGHLDLLVGSSDEGGIHIYEGDSTGKNWKHLSSGLPMSDWANRVIAADMNNDGLVDAVAAFSRGPRVWINDGNGFWNESSEGLPSPVIGGLYHGLAVADMNGDGLKDIVAANWVDGPEVFFQNKNGSFTPTADVFPGMQGGSIGLAVGDINHDNKMDIVVSGRLEPTPGFVRGVFVLLGNGNGTWKYIPNSGLPNSGLRTTMGVTLGDINGDGTLDVAAASGLKVETTAGPTAPAISTHLLTWTTVFDGKTAAIATGSND